MQEVIMLETIGERVSLIRKSKNPKMTQAEFADSINMSRSNLANLENDRYRITDRVISDICAVHNVNRTWLETGEGEMFADMSRTEKLAMFVAQALADKPESFRHWLVGVLIDLDDDGWQLLEDAAKLFAGYGEQKKKEDE
jgi:transcriptional regulator with XRE-family HTH domain